MTDSKEIVEAPNSVAISSNAKGDLSFAVKVYAKTIREAMDQAQKASVEMRLFVESEKEG